MVDMAQADRTLRRQNGPTYEMSWLVALRKAACEMGYSSWADVPDKEIETLKNLAREIMGQAL